MISLNIQIREVKTKIGESVYVVGNIRQLGLWNAENGLQLQTSPSLYPCWKLYFQDPLSQDQKQEDQNDSGNQNNLLQLRSQFKNLKETIMNDSPNKKLENNNQQSNIGIECLIKIDLLELCKQKGENFKIEYKYFIKDKLNEVNWEFGSQNRQIYLWELIKEAKSQNLFNDPKSILVIQDEIYNNVKILPSIFAEKNIITIVFQEKIEKQNSQIKIRKNSKMLLESSSEEELGADNDLICDSTESCSEEKNLNDFDSWKLNQYQKQFIENLIEKDKILQTRNQKLLMIKDILMFNNVSERLPGQNSAFINDRKNSKFSYSKDFVFEIDGLAVICSYLYFSFGTSNSHLCQITNQKNTQQFFEIIKHIDQNLHIFNTDINTHFQSNSHLIKVLKSLLNFVFSNKNCQTYTQIFNEIIKLNANNQIAQDLQKFQSNFISKPALTLLFDLDFAYSLRQSLHILSIQNLNQQQRVDSESAQQMYVLASLAEIEVETIIFDKIKEIIIGTIANNKTGQEQLKSKETYLNIQFKQRKAANSITRGTADKKSDVVKQEKIKVLLAMMLLIFKNLQYSDQGECFIQTNSQPSEINCLIASLKSIMKNFLNVAKPESNILQKIKNQRKNLTVRGRSNSPVKSEPQNKMHLLQQILTFTARTKKFCQLFAKQILIPFTTLSKQTQEQMSAQQQTYEKFEKNYINSQAMNSLILCLDYIRQDCLKQLGETLGGNCVEKSKKINLNDQKLNIMGKNQSKQMKIYKMELKKIDIKKMSQIQISKQKMEQMDAWFNNFISKIFKQGKDVIQIIKETNQSQAIISPLVFGKKAWNQKLIQKLQMQCPEPYEFIDYIILPMIIPVKFAIQEAKLYHHIRIMLKKLDETLGSDPEKEQLRLKIVDNLCNLFKLNQSSIDLIIEYIKNHFKSINLYQKDFQGFVIEQSPTLEIENELQIYQNQYIVDDNNIGEYIQKAWLNLQQPEAVQLRESLRNQQNTNQLKIRTYLSQMTLMIRQNRNQQKTNNDVYSFQACGFKNGIILIDFYFIGKNNQQPCRLELDIKGQKCQMVNLSSQKNQIKQDKQIEIYKNEQQDQNELIELGQRVSKICQYFEKSIMNNKEFSYKHILGQELLQYVRELDEGQRRLRALSTVQEDSDEYSSDAHEESQLHFTANYSLRGFIRKPSKSQIFQYDYLSNQSQPINDHQDFNNSQQLLSIIIERIDY